MKDEISCFTNKLNLEESGARRKEEIIRYLNVWVNIFDESEPVNFLKAISNFFPKAIVTNVVTNLCSS